MVVADASVLIALAKTGRIGLLRDLYGEIAVGPRVKEEVIEGGRRIRAAEVSVIEAAFQGKWLREVTPGASERVLSRRILRGSRLHEGEAEVVAMASVRKLMVLLDDKEARILARAMAVEFMGTAGILLEAFLRRALDFGGLEGALEDLTQVIWLSPSVVTEILRRARGARR